MMRINYRDPLAGQGVVLLNIIRPHPQRSPHPGPDLTTMLQLVFGLR